VVFIPLSDDNPLRSIPFQWITIALIAANCVVFLLENVEGADTAIASFALIPSELFGSPLPAGPAQGWQQTMQVPEGITLVSYQFLHGDIFHLLSNMLFLWVFGDNVEDAMGHVKYLAFYFVCGIAGGLAHAAFLPSSSLPLIGASGAVAGVIAAYLILHPRVRVWCLAFRFIPLRISAMWVLGLWVVTQLVMVGLQVCSVRAGCVWRLPAGAEELSVAWWAHVGGMVAGAILILFLRRPGVPLFDRGLPPAPAAVERPR
jgi:membrane associated rhomboid family serine protease